MKKRITGFVVIGSLIVYQVVPLVLAILKLTGIIDISWLWVFVTIWGDRLLGFLSLILSVIKLGFKQTWDTLMTAYD